MKYLYIFFPVLFALFLLKGNAQDSINFQAQLSGNIHWNPKNKLAWWNGGRIIPQLNYEHKLQPGKQIDFEASANLFGNAGFEPFDSSSFNGKVKPYRLWVRYSTRQLEIRVGLQKINFGSASILRPLMWFELVDPRDPLKLTDGVWGVLARYYFLNNANIWLWGLYGNRNLKGWEIFETRNKVPEFGSRVQVPVPKGETGFSYHHRMTDPSTFSDSSFAFNRVPENRFGFDVKLDVVVGCWFEGSWSIYNKDMGKNSNQKIFNLGMDYTFGLGNGFTLILEQLIASYSEKSFDFKNTAIFSLFTMSYPMGLFYNLSGIIYYDWTNNSVYNFLNLQRQFNRFTLYLMGYINPVKYNIPTQTYGEILYAGSGIQLMAVLNL